MVGFHVYIAASSLGYVDYRDDVNFIPPTDASGVAHYALAGLEQFSNVYIALKSSRPITEVTEFADKRVRRTIFARLSAEERDRIAATLERVQLTASGDRPRRKVSARPPRTSTACCRGS